MCKPTDNFSRPRHDFADARGDTTPRGGFQRPGRGDRCRTAIYQPAPPSMVISNHWCHWGRETVPREQLSNTYDATSAFATSFVNIDSGTAAQRESDLLSAVLWKTYECARYFTFYTSGTAVHIWDEKKKESTTVKDRGRRARKRNARRAFNGCLARR